MFFVYLLAIVFLFKKSTCFPELKINKHWQANEGKGRDPPTLLAGMYTASEKISMEISSKHEK